MSAKSQGDPGEDHASRVGAESPCSDMKRAAAKKLIERYFYQLTEGCGNPQCSNQNCASSGKITNLTPNQAAAQAIQLFSQEARLCDGTQPSKVARTTLEPGPASLAKSLPVKNVNPTCSDEGTILAECNTAICFLLDSICRQTSTTEDDLNSTKIDNSSNCNSDVQLEKRDNDDLSDIIILEDKSTKSYSRSNEDVYSNQCSNSSNITVNEDCLLEILKKYNIRIPKYQIKQARRQAIRYRKQPSPKQVIQSSRSKKKPQQTRNRRTIRKRTIRKFYTQKSMIKLLILTLYLKYLEKERYTEYYLSK